MTATKLKHNFDYCPTMGTPYIYSDDCVPNTRSIHKTRCKQWTCEYCAPINQLQHQIRIYNGIQQLQNSGYNIDFVTLTSHEKLRGFESTYRVWQSAWGKLGQRWRRILATNTRQCEDKSLLPSAGQLAIAYVWVIETHKDGRLHVHGLLVHGVHKRWWKDNARQCGLGYQVECEHVENASNAVSYVTKYIGKQCLQDLPLKRVRRINYSQTFPPLELLSEDSTWSVIDPKTSIESIIEQAWHIENLDVQLHGKPITEIVYT
jgi:hypothetical protein